MISSTIASNVCEASAVVLLVHRALGGTGGLFLYEKASRLGPPDATLPRRSSMKMRAGSCESGRVRDRSSSEELSVKSSEDAGSVEAAQPTRFKAAVETAATLASAMATKG